jgi:hypothetical protein
MPAIIRILEKTVKLTEDIAKIQLILNKAYSESGLIQEQTSKSDKQEFCGGEKQERSGLIARVLILYENLSDKAVGGYQWKLLQFDYRLDAPARKLREAYADYLNSIFNKHVTARNSAKKDQVTLDYIIDSPHVYVREILLRLFTAAISVDKNNSTSSSEASKIINCLEIFLRMINQTKVLYDAPFPFFNYISPINMAFASQHKEWIYLLKEMQEIIDTMHKHTSTISRLIETLNKAKTSISMQLIAYLSERDISYQEMLLPEWIKYALLEVEQEWQKKENVRTISLVNDTENFNKLATQNFNSLIVNKHKTQIINIQNKRVSPYISKIHGLYKLLAETNILLEILDQIDTLFSTTGWILIISNVLNLSNVSRLIDQYSKNISNNLRLDTNSPVLKNKENIKRALVASDSFSGVDFRNSLQISSQGIKDLQNSAIKNCITSIISASIGNLQELQKYLGVSLINQEELNLLGGRVEASGQEAPISCISNNQLGFWSSLPVNQHVVPALQAAPESNILIKEIEDLNKKSRSVIAKH